MGSAFGNSLATKECIFLRHQYTLSPLSCRELRLVFFRLRLCNPEPVTPQLQFNVSVLI
jgi:hypothetical protein